MKFQEGYVYHINDAYFAKAKDDKLMQNKEGGTYRPTFLCMEDKATPGLLWVVPMSSKVAKFQAIHDRQQSKYGKCLTIVMGEYDGQQAAFLLQNMFPITEQYLDHIHTRNGNPVPVKYSIAQEVRSNMQQLLQLISRGKQVVFPDVKRLKAMMIEELHPAAHRAADQQHPQQTAASPEPTRQSIKERMAAAQAESDRRNSSTAADLHHDKNHDLEK